MTEMTMLYAWAQARLRQLRHGDSDDAGFGTLEWVALAGVIIIAAIVVATTLMNTAKDGAARVKVQ